MDTDMVDEPDSPMQTPPRSPESSSNHQSNQPSLHFDQSMSSLSSNQYSQSSQVTSPTGDQTISEFEELLSGPILCGVCSNSCDVAPGQAAPRYLTCSGCLISVHIECYGISKMSKSHSRGQRLRWRCEKCRLDDLMRLTQHTPAVKHTLCKLCPNSEFALMLAKPYRFNLQTGEPALVQSETSFQVHPLLNAYDFVHTICAIFTPGCRLEGHHQDYHSGMPLPESMPWATRKKHRSYQLIMGIEDIPSENRSNTCSICQNDMGAVVRCAYPVGTESADESQTPCDVWMHVTCAAKQRLSLKCSQSLTDPQSVNCLVYCEHHSPPPPTQDDHRPIHTDEYHQKLNSPSPDRTSQPSQSASSDHADQNGQNGEAEMTEQ